MGNLEKAFRRLREAWYDCHIKSYSHERVWEEEWESDRRDMQNAESKALFDEQTEFIIKNEYYDELDDRLVRPSCIGDMYFAKGLYGL